MRRRDFISLLGSAAAAWPLTAQSQQPRVPLIGILSTSAGPGDFPRQDAAFRQGLGESGYVEGRSVELLYRFAENQYDRLPSLAADLLGRRVAVIVAGGVNSALAAKAATTTVPIVFQLGADPVELGLVASLNHPAGNVTGATFLARALFAKRLELLHEAVPAATLVAFLYNPANLDASRIRETEDAGRTLGLDLFSVTARNASEIEEAFTALSQRRAGAVIVDGDPLFFVQRRQLAELAARHAVPAIYHARETVEAGGLMSYGADIPEAFRIAGIYAGRILKGEKPADLPVQQSAKIELIINLKTAKALGITFPLTLLGRADEVIE
jgi:putative ABC transport system substrate-binding protein